jgi:hypothetical protein
MTPAERAFYFGVPNIILVALPEPNEPCEWLPDPTSFEQYVIFFCPLKKVVWFIVGGSRLVAGRNSLELIQQLAHRFPNVVGVMMGGFFRSTLDSGRVGTLTSRELGYIQSRSNVGGCGIE